MTVSTFFRTAVGFLLLTGLLTRCSDQTPAETDSTSSVAQSEEGLRQQGPAYIEDDVSAPTVLRIAMESDDHKTLVAAVQAAHLENSLVNQGPLMVFAPTDAAFEALPEGTVDDLLKPVNEDQLADILKYHVTPGNYSKDFLKKFKKLGQANSQDVQIEVDGDDVYVGGAKIIASVPASNGIVHVIDKVMLPPESE